MSAGARSQALDHRDSLTRWRPSQTPASIFAPGFVVAGNTPNSGDEGKLLGNTRRFELMRFDPRAIRTQIENFNAEGFAAEFSAGVETATVRRLRSLRHAPPRRASRRRVNSYNLSRIRPAMMDRPTSG